MKTIIEELEVGAVKTKTTPTVPHRTLDNIVTALRQWLAERPYSSRPWENGNYDAGRHELYFAKHGCGQWLSITVRHMIEEHAPAEAVARIEVAQELYDRALQQCENAFSEWMPKA